MKVTIIPIVIVAFGTVTKGLLKGMEDLEVGWRVETIQTKVYWQRPEYGEEFWRLEETCCHSNSIERPSANADVKKSNGVSECSKLAQKEYKARYDWVGKVIHWEMCRKFQFDHANKWYMHNPAPVLENATHKLLWDFNLQTDHLIAARRPDLIIINKKKKKKEKLQNCRHCCPGGPQY